MPGVRIGDPAAVLAVFVLAGFGLALVVAPDASMRVAIKEGPIEHASHAVLALALAACIARAASGRHALHVAGAAWLSLVLAEELAWGAVLGIDAIASRLTAATGRDDLHNAWGGSSYLLFALPLLAVIVAALREPPAGVAGWPRRADAIAIAIVALGSLAATLAGADVEDAVDEVAELSLYVVLAGIPLRRAAGTGPA